MIGNDSICNILAVSQLFTDHGPTEEMFPNYVARIIHVLFTMANLHFLKEMLMLLHAKKKEEFKKNKIIFTLKTKSDEFCFITG